VQLNLLEYIAQQCFYTFGTAVSLARIDFPVEEGYDDENCPESLIITDSKIFPKNDGIIFPNPTNGLIHFKINDDMSTILNIVNMEGISFYNKRVSGKDEDITIDASEWPSGCYVLSYTADRLKTFKLVITK
jgi:hypothetical protein